MDSLVPSSLAVADAMMSTVPWVGFPETGVSSLVTSSASMRTSASEV